MGYVTYSDEARKITTQRDFGELIKRYNEEIKRLEADYTLAEQIAVERLNQISEWEKNGEYTVIGHFYRDGNNKGALVILRYPDGSQKDFRRYASKVAELREKVELLKQEYPGDWSKFEDKL